MENYNFKDQTTGNKSSSMVVSLVPGDPLADIAFFDVRHFSKLTITTAVAVAALTDYKVFARGDDNAQWSEVIRGEMNGYGCTDSTTDFTLTAVGQSAIAQIDTSFWAHIKVQAKSAGAAIVTTTGGVE